MIGLIDYDAGNIRSVEKALRHLGQKVVLTRDPQVLLKADKVILPGVGSFGHAMENLNRYGLVPVIRRITERGRPFSASVWGCSSSLSAVRKVREWTDLAF